MEGGREALCENYNIAIRCPCCVQPMLPSSSSTSSHSSFHSNKENTTLRRT